MTRNEGAIEELFKNAIELRDLERFDDAIEKFTQILAMSPTRRAPILGVMGHIYFKQRAFDKALECYTEAVSLSPMSEMGSLGLFHTLWNMGREWDAFAEAKRFLTLRDSDEYFLMIEEMRDAFIDAGIDPSTPKRPE